MCLSSSARSPHSVNGCYAPRVMPHLRQCISTRSVPLNAAYISRLVSSILWTASTVIHGQNRDTCPFQFCVSKAPNPLYINTCSNVLSRVALKHIWIVVQYNITSGSPLSVFSVKLRIVLRMNDWIMNKQHISHASQTHTHTHTHSSSRRQKTPPLYHKTEQMKSVGDLNLNIYRI